MTFEIFEILRSKCGHSEEMEIESIVINLTHIISVTPMSLYFNGESVPGYVIGTTDGKKIGAIKIPKSLEDAFKENSVSKEYKRTAKINELAKLLDGKLSNPTINCREIARCFITREIDSEAVVRMAHGENMNIVHNILSDFNLRKGFND